MLLPVLLLLTTCEACGSPRQRTLPRDGALPPSEYHVGIEDVLEIAVWKEPGLSATVPVRPDGRITLPLAGELQAAGHTTRQLEQAITARLKRTLQAPVVSVLIKEINSSRVFVLGEVRHPGSFALRGALTVLQALALAGGLTEFADGDAIVILRPLGNGSAQPLTFDYDDAARGAADSFLMKAGDTVVVP